jgi:oligoribonuclease
MSNLIWLDLEMTGLNLARDRIIEIATVVTDSQLTILAEGPVFAIHQNRQLIGGMDEWNTRQHYASGLVKRVLASKVREREAEQKTLEFLKLHVTKGKSPMCGNSVHQDRRFLEKYMPELESYFHYRNLDVSTLKELAKYWRPKLLKGFVKESRHLALYDIKDSIAELAYYRQHFLNLSDDKNEA